MIAFRDSTRASSGSSPALAPPPGNPRFPLFDSLRGLAVLAVVAFHAAEFSGQLNGSIRGDVAMVLGAQGPILFFVISGFLLYRPFAAAHADGRRGPPVARYARRRALRILPAYWVALTVLAVFPAILGVFTSDWWRYYGFLQLYSPRTEGLGIPPAWTLCVEVAFYVALPIWAALVGRLVATRAPRRWAQIEIGGLLVLMAAGVAVQVATSRLAFSHAVGQSALGQSSWLGLGMLLAAVSVAAERSGAEPAPLRAVRRHPGLCWAGAAAAFAGLTALAPKGGIFGLAAVQQTGVPLDQELARLALTAVFTALLVLPAVFVAGRGVPARVLGARPVALLGLISYGVYLWHFTLIELIALPRAPNYSSDVGLNLVGHLGLRSSTIPLFLLALAASCLVATVSYRWVELPFLRRKERAGVRAPRRSLAPRG